MSVFGSIVSAIFGSKHAASVTAAAGSSAPSPSAGSAKGASAPLHPLLRRLAPQHRPLGRPPFRQLQNRSRKLTSKPSL